MPEPIRTIGEAIDEVLHRVLDPEVADAYVAIRREYEARVEGVTDGDVIDAARAEFERKLRAMVETL